MKLQRIKAGSDFETGKKDHRGLVYMMIIGPEKEVEAVEKILKYKWGEFNTQCPEFDEGIYETYYFIHTDDLESFKDDYKEAKSA